MLGGWYRALVMLVIGLSLAAPGDCAWALSGQASGNMPSMTGPVFTLPALAAPMTAARSSNSSVATPQFRRYGVDDGLLRGQVYAVTQDRKGLMWFGSANGLMRYDASVLKIFAMWPMILGRCRPTRPTRCTSMTTIASGPAAYHRAW